MQHTDNLKAKSKMMSCMSCGETMNAIYSYKAREECMPCGGQALNSLNPKYPQPPLVKGKENGTR